MPHLSNMFVVKLQCNQLIIFVEQYRGPTVYAQYFYAHSQSQRVRYINAQNHFQLSLLVLLRLVNFSIIFEQICQNNLGNSSCQ